MVEGQPGGNTQPFKLAFIEVQYRKRIVLPQEFIARLPGTVMFFASIQFHNQFDALKEQLEKSGKQVLVVQPKHSWRSGQLLGCGVEDWSAQEFDAFVYVGDGDFHPTALLFKNDKEVFQYDPKRDEQRVLTPDYVKQLRVRQQAAMSAFRMANKIGVVMTTKYGQNRMKMAEGLGAKYPDKEFFFFLEDEIHPHRLEDFPFIECFVNTACPRMQDDNQKFPKPVVNLADVLGQDW